MIVPDDLERPLSDAEVQALGGEAPTLDDALESGGLDAAQPVSPPAAIKPLEPEALITLIGDLSSLDLPPELAASYKKEFGENALVNMGVRFSGICDALAKYGMGSNGGSMPDWLKVCLGVAALGAGVALTRGKYADKPNAEANFDPGGLDGDGGDAAATTSVSFAGFGPNLTGGV